jgi:hypothetical protein
MHQLRPTRCCCRVRLAQHPARPLDLAGLAVFANRGFTTSAAASLLIGIACSEMRSPLRPDGLGRTTCHRR